VGTEDVVDQVNEVLPVLHVVVDADVRLNPLLPHELIAQLYCVQSCVVFGFVVAQQGFGVARVPVALPVGAALIRRWLTAICVCWAGARKGASVEAIDTKRDLTPHVFTKVVELVPSLHVKAAREKFVPDLGRVGGIRKIFVLAVLFFLLPIHVVYDKVPKATPETKMHISIKCEDTVP
jgi:hypothetical protein